MSRAPIVLLRSVGTTAQGPGAVALIHPEWEDINECI